MRERPERGLPLVEEWIGHPCMWLRRTALLHQVHVHFICHTTTPGTVYHTTTPGTVHFICHTTTPDILYATLLHQTFYMPHYYTRYSTFYMPHYYTIYHTTTPYATLLHQVRIGYTIGCLAILGIYPRWLLIRHEGGARGPYQ